MVTCNHVTDYVSLSKSPNKKHKFLLFKSYSEKNTLNMIIHISASSLLILIFFKFCYTVIVEEHYMYQFWVPELAFFEL
jgi:hypothetical protein